jgi:hypothetical protein
MIYIENTELNGDSAVKTIEIYTKLVSILTKILQGIVIGLSCVAISNMKKQKSIAAENRSTVRTSK